MAQSPERQPTSTPPLVGKLATHDPDTYIIVCLHCLHYFRSLTDLLRHRLLNHNILDNVAPGESLPRISSDGSWLVTGGDSEPQNMAQPPQQAPLNINPIRNTMPTPSPPPPPSGSLPPPPTSAFHQSQFRPMLPHQPPQFYGLPPPSNRPIPPFPGGQFRPQHQYYPPQIPPNRSSPVPNPTLQYRQPNTAQPNSSFSPAAREFVPSGMGLKMQSSSQTPSSQDSQKYQGTGR